jgi:hypothetical protein
MVDRDSARFMQWDQGFFEKLNMFFFQWNSKAIDDRT